VTQFVEKWRGEFSGRKGVQGDACAVVGVGKAYLLQGLDETNQEFGGAALMHMQL
jgi:hypothetical protein